MPKSFAGPGTDRDLEKQYHPSAEYVQRVLDDAIRSVGYFFAEMKSAFAVESVTTSDTNRKLFRVVPADVPARGGLLETFNDVKTRTKYRIAGNAQSVKLFTIGHPAFGEVVEYFEQPTNQKPKKTPERAFRLKRLAELKPTFPEGFELKTARDEYCIIWNPETRDEKKIVY